MLYLQNGEKIYVRHGDKITLREAQEDARSKGFELKRIRDLEEYIEFEVTKGVER